MALVKVVLFLSMLYYLSSMNDKVKNNPMNNQIVHCYFTYLGGGQCQRED